MESFGKCSNLPVFEDQFQPPLEKTTYTLQKCQFSTEKFPSLQEGFYRISMIAYGQVEWSITFIFEITWDK